MGFDMNVLVNPGIEHYLGEALAVSQIHKYDTAVIPAAQDPAHYNYFFSDIFCTELTTAVSSSHFSQ
jgi:hypothetical protein